MADASIAASTPLTDELARHWGEIVLVMKEMCAYYGYEGEVPKHVIESLPAPEAATIGGEAAHRKRLLQKLHIHLMALWADGKIPGPMTAENLNALAKKAEASAAGLKKMKQDKAAASQLAKAERYRSMVSTATQSHKGWW